MSADALRALWEQALQDSTADQVRWRALDCLRVGVMEMVRSARDPRWRNVARALSAGDGPAKVTGLEQSTDTTSAIVANSLLMHAFNREDSYRVAAHPGLVVVPTALALQRADDAAQLLQAVAVGYAIAGSLTDGLTPRASEAGWRLAALTAPVTAASVAAVVLDLDDDDAVSALRTAAACMGGDIRSLAGDDWRLQPGLFALAGVYAARAASGGGVRGSAGALESMAAKVLGEPWERPHHDPIPAIMRVTFKQYAAPMFAQAIIAALEGAGDIAEPVNKVVVHVAPFAAGYATDGAGRQLGVASIPDLVSAAIAEPPTRRRVPPGAVVVHPAAELTALQARLELHMAGGRVLQLEGNGDSSGWSSDDIAKRCRTWARAECPSLVEAFDSTSSPAAAVALLLDAWKATVVGTAAG